MKLLQPPHPSAAFQGRMQCMARGVGLWWGWGGGESWACLNSKSGEGGREGERLTLSSQEKEVKEGRGWEGWGGGCLGLTGRMPARQGGVLIRAGSLFHEHTGHITPLSNQGRGKKKEEKKKKGSGVTQSMCCTSHMCSLGLLNAVIRLCAGSKPQHNNKAGPSSFIVSHVPGNPEKVKRPQSGTGWKP